MKTQVILELQQPYAWAMVRNFLAKRAIDGLEVVCENSYHRTFQWENASGQFTAEFLTQQHAFCVDIEIDDTAALDGVILNIRRLLDIDTCTHAVERALLAAGLPKAKILAGLRLPGVWSLFEAGCRAILGQQISVSAAVTSVERLVHHCGQRKSSRLFFPAPSALAEADLSFLRTPQQRKDTLKALAVACCSDNHKEEPDNWLQIKGIGPWTVAYAKMRGLSQPDIWLGTDLVIKKQMALHQLDSDHASPWRSYLTLQLWENVE